MKKPEKHLSKLIGSSALGLFEKKRTSSAGLPACIKQSLRAVAKDIPTAAKAAKDMPTLRSAGSALAKTILTLSCLAAVSCQTMAPFYFDQLLPAAVYPLPPGQSILLLDQSADSPMQPQHHVFVDYNYRHDTILSSDSAAIRLMLCVENELRQSGHFLRVDRLGSYEQRADAEYLRRLSDSLGVDLILLLKQHQIKSFMNTDGLVVGHNVLAAAQWELYQAGAGSAPSAERELDTLARFVLMDTLRMGNWVFREDEPFYSLPDFEDNMPSLAQIQAGHLIESLLHVWCRVERFYYIAGDYRIKLAVDQLRRDNWEQAARYWEQVYAEGNKVNRYRAALNMALYYERQDRVDEALHYLQAAREIPETFFFSPSLYEQEILDKWIRLLLQRQKELELF